MTRHSKTPVPPHPAASRRPAPALAAAALALLASAALAQETPSGPEVVDRVVALVNGDMITLTELERQVTVQSERLGVPEDDPALVAEFRSRILQGMVDNALILQLAEERGLRVPDRYFDDWKEQTIKEMNLPDEAEFIRQVELQGTNLEELKKQFFEGVLIQEIRRQDIEERVRISEPEIEQRYRENVDEFVTPPKVRLSEIVIHIGEAGEADARSRIEEAKRLVASGNAFSEVAGVRSESGSAEGGGALGLFELGELDETFRTVVEDLETGGVSDPIRLGDSFYLLSVEERTEETTTPLDEVRNQIAESLYAEKMETEMAAFVENLRKNAIVEIRLEDSPSS